MKDTVKLALSLCLATPAALAGSPRVGQSINSTKVERSAYIDQLNKNLYAAEIRLEILESQLKNAEIEARMSGKGVVLISVSLIIGAVLTARGVKSVIRSFQLAKETTRNAGPVVHFALANGERLKGLAKLTAWSLPAYAAVQASMEVISLTTDEVQKLKSDIEESRYEIEAIKELLVTLKK